MPRAPEPSVPSCPAVAPRRRTPRAVAGGAVVLAGLASSRRDDLGADLAGGALYAALVLLLVLLVAPRTRPAVAAGCALGSCAVVELAQLTAGPAALAAAWPPAAYVLGTTFVATDLLAYAAGVGVVTVVDVLARRRDVGRATPPPG